MNDHFTARGSIWDADNLALTLGSILAITIGAFQGLAVATITPALTDDLDGRHLYGWVFNAFLIPQIIGTVVGGREVDRREPWKVFYPALAVFAVGLLVCAIADSMMLIFLGRALVGFGAGASFSTIYAIISGVYEDQLRPAMLAAVSSAWIVPSLIGPLISGWITDTFHWRWVFAGLLPLLLVVAPLTWPSYRKVRLVIDPATAATNSKRVPIAALLALGTFLFLVGPDLTTFAETFGVTNATSVNILGIIVSMAGLVIIVPSLRRLLPNGTFTLRPMLGSAIGIRALAFGAFAVTETYVVYALKQFGGLTSAQAGLILTVGSLTWTAGSILQARQDRTYGAGSRPARIVFGTLLMTTGVATISVMVLVTQDIWWPVAMLAWMVTGLGIGLVYTTSTTVAFANAPRGQDGLVSSSTLLGDLFTSAIGIGIGGFLLASLLAADWSEATSSGLAMTLSLIMLTAAWIGAIRMRADN